MPASPDVAHRLPMAIMIDDNRVARPQSGFSSASIVYQAPVDGGEDRYMLIFQEGTASDIGPVRSARPYFVYWATEYKALYGHFGGDNKSLYVVLPALSKSVYNQDDLSGGSCPYHRIATRAAPHNAYTNSAALINCLPHMGYPSTYQGLPVRPFQDDLPASQRTRLRLHHGPLPHRNRGLPIPSRHRFLSPLCRREAAGRSRQQAAGDGAERHRHVPGALDRPRPTGGLSLPMSALARPSSSEKARRSSARGRRRRTPPSRASTTRRATRYRSFEARSSSKACRSGRP